MSPCSSLVLLELNHLTREALERPKEYVPPPCLSASKFNKPYLHPPHINRFHGVMVSTQDSESCNPSSNLGGTYNFSKSQNRIFFIFPQLDQWVRQYNKLLSSFLFSEAHRQGRGLLGRNRIYNEQERRRLSVHS